MWKRLFRAERIALIVSLVFFVHCGDSRSTMKDSGADGGMSNIHEPSVSLVGYACKGLCDSSDGSSDHPSEPLPRPRCPEEEPSIGEDCDEEMLCGYGDGLRTDCRSVYECQGSWRASGLTPEAECAKPPSGFCPQTPQHGKGCQDLLEEFAGPQGFVDGPTVCEYEELLCYCSPCGISRRGSADCRDGRAHWVCYGPPEHFGCPSSPPNIGEGCDLPALECHYNSPCGVGGMAFFCRRNEWERATGTSCPL